MSVLKGVALVVVGLALQSAPPLARAATAECSGGGAPRLIGLDRTETDVCADRFAVAPEPPPVPVPQATTTAGQARAVVPIEDLTDGSCARFVPALALTVPVACRREETEKSDK